MLMGAAAKMLKPSENKKKVTKKIQSSKFISGKSDPDKKGSAIVKSETSSIVAKPSVKLVPTTSLPTVKEIKVPQGKVSFDFLNGILDSLVKNTSSLLKISKSEYKSEVKGAEAERRSDQLERKRQREESVESRSRTRDEGKALKIAAPKMPLFDGALEFLKRFAIGTAIMQFINWFSDPEKRDSIIGFLTNNMELIILGMVGVMGALILAPLTPLIGAFFTLLSITTSIIGSLVSLIVFNPAVLAAVGVALGAAALIAGPLAQSAGSNSQLTGPNAVWKAPNLSPASRKAIIESTFEHIPYSSWPQEAKDLYEQDLRSLKIDLKTAQDQLRQKLAKHTQQRNQIQQSQQTSTPTTPITPTSTTTPSPAKPQTTLVPQSSLPALPPTGIDPIHGPAQMYGASRSGGKRKHAGQDFDAGPNDTFYSRIGGEVIYSDNAGGGYGNVVDVYNADLNHTERIAEGDVNLVKKGDIISPGTPVQRGTSQTGVFHYEIRTGRATASGSFSGTVDPIAFLNNLGNIQVAKTKPSTPEVSQYAPYEQPAGTPALVPIPIQSQQQQQPQVASNVMQPSSSGPTHEQVLNTYYTYQVLGFLYKQG